MKNIAVCADFVTGTYRGQIDAAAESAGYTVTYFESQDALGEQIADYEVAFGYIPPEQLPKAKELRWLCSASAGVDHYMDETIWPNPDCILTNSSGAYGPTISEHIVMVSLMLLRRMPEYLPTTARHEWEFFTPIRSIMGSRVVILGTGDIGSHTARRMKALGAEVTGVSRSGKSTEPAFDRVLRTDELNSVLPAADLLILALPATRETVGILSRERIGLLPPAAYVINVGRGSAIDQGALVEALQAHRLAGAALDVMTPEPLPADDPLWTCPNTVLTPHVSGNMSLGLTCQLAVDLFCRDLANYAAGKPLANLVDRRLGY